MAIPGINELQELATKYSKQQLGQMAQNGLIDPQKAVMAGMMRDRIVQQESAPPTPTTTVAEDVLAPPQQPAPEMPPMPEDTGIASLPAQQEFAAGGLVSFADGGRVSMFGGAQGYTPYREDPREREALISKIRSGVRQYTLPGAGVGAPQQAYAAQLLRDANRMNIESLRDADRLLFGDTPAAASMDATTPPTATATTPTPPGAPMANPAAGGRPAAETGIAALTGPRRSSSAATMIDPKLYKIDGPESVDAARAEREAAYTAAGVNPDAYAEQRKAAADDRARIASDREDAKWQAIAQFGAGMAASGSKQGSFAGAMAEGTTQGLNSIRTAMKDIKADERGLQAIERQLAIAENEYKRSGADTDLKRVKELEALRASARMKLSDDQRVAAMRAEDVAVRREAIRSNESLYRDGLRGGAGGSGAAAMKYSTLLPKDRAAIVSQIKSSPEYMQEVKRLKKSHGSNADVGAALQTFLNREFEMLTGLPLAGAGAGFELSPSAASYYDKYK